MARKKTVKESFNKKVIPLMLLMLVPMIMYHQLISYDTELTHPYLVSAERYADIFSFYKAIALYIVAILCIAFYVLYTKKSQREFKKERIKYYIPLAVYSLFIILSMIFAIYPKAGVFGTYERFEGGLALLAYIVVMLYATEIVRNETDMKYIFGAFLGMVTVISAIGILQALGTDIFVWPFVQNLIGIPAESHVKQTFDAWAYSTLYNPNNVGQFSSLVSPVVLGIFLAYKSVKGKIYAGIVFIMAVAVGFASSSANAIAGLAAGALLFTILFISNLIPKTRKWKIIVFSIVGIIIIGFVAVSGRIVRKVINSGFVQNELAAFKPDKDDVYFYDLHLTEDTVTFDTNVGKFYLKYLDGGITFFDSDMKFMPFEQMDKRINFTEEPYKDQWFMTLTAKNILTVNAKRAYSYTRIEIIFDEDRFIGVRGSGDTIIHSVLENQMPEKWRGLETIASRRGYLWLVTLSRLDEVLFIGAGPDNFIYWFEQNDVIGKVNFLHRVAILADKPHNWYLQIASQTGVVSLLAFLAFVGIYIVDSIRLLGVRRKKGFYEYISGGIACGTVGLLASSLFVDSTLGVTALFFALIGIGIVSNKYVRETRIRERNLINPKKKSKAK